MFQLRFSTGSLNQSRLRQDLGGCSLRILHVATLVSPDGAYGGPLRVALNQLSALQDLGHETLFVGGYRGYGHEPPTVMNEVSVKLFPVRHLVKKLGFASMISISMMSWLRVHAREYDVVHVHLARDMITMPVAWMLSTWRIPYVVQTHGMVDESSKRLARLMDFLLTKRAVRRAHSVAFLTSREEKSLRNLFGLDETLTELPNGVPEASLDHAPAVCNEVLFLARLHPRKRPATFVGAAFKLLDRFPDAIFALVGPDEGEGEAITKMIRNGPLGGRVTWEGSVDPDSTIARMSRASIYVLPAVDEPFPMSVLEALSLGIPVVITDSCGLAPFIREAGAGLVTDGSEQNLVDAIATLLADAQLLGRMSIAAFELAKSTFEMRAVATRLTTLYSEAARGDGEINS